MKPEWRWIYEWVCGLTNCVWGKRACQGGGAWILSPPRDWVFSPGPWDSAENGGALGARARSAPPRKPLSRFFEQPCPLQRGFGQQSWLIPNFRPNSTAQDYPRYFQIEKKDSFWRALREREREREWVSRVWGLQQDFVWTDLRNNPWVLLAEVSTTLVLYQSI